MTRKLLRNNLLSILTVMGVIAGIVGGVIIRNKNPELVPTDDVPMGLKIPGDLLLRGLNLVVLPLVVTSLIIGLAGNTESNFNKQAGFTILYYLLTTLVAAGLGLIIVSVIEPGNTHTTPKASDVGLDTSVLDVIKDIIKNMVPGNMVAMAHKKTQTVVSNAGVVKEEEVEGINMLGVICVSIAIGVVVMRNRDRAQPFLDFCVSLNMIITQLIKFILWYSPIGIMFLIMSELSGQGVGKYADKVGMYIVTVLIGLAIHFFIVLPGILFGFTRRNPLVYYKSLIPAMATAFGTASSTVTIPVTQKCVQNAGISKSTIDFVVPVGATVNMDGTALYEAVACLFIAQLNGIQLSNPKIILTGLTATVAAIGAAGIPSAGLVTLVMVLNTVGLDTRHIALILTVDWFLDRFRTMTNIVGDAVGCAVIDKFASCDDETKAVKFTELQDTEQNNDLENAVGA